MHERYFYCPDMMILIASLCFTKRFWMLLASQFSSVGAMSCYLFSKGAMDMRILLMIEFLVFVTLFFCMREDFRNPQGQEVVMQFEAKKHANTAPEEPAAETPETAG